MAARINIPKICELSYINGQFVGKTTDDAKKEIVAQEVVDFTKRFFSINDDPGDNDDARAFFDQRGEKACNWSIVRDSIQEPARARDVRSLDSGRTSHANADPARFHKEAAALRMLGIRDADGKELELPDFNNDAAIFDFFGKVNDSIHALARKKSGQLRVALDAAPSIYVFTELLKQVPVLIEEEFAELWARRVFPIRNLNTWLPQWSYKRYGKRGSLPQYVDTEFSPTNINQQSERVAPVIRPIVFYDNGCFWNLIELERHAEAVANGAANISLDSDRIDTMIRMMLEWENLITWFGDPQANILGMFSPQADTGVVRTPAAALFGAGTTEDDRELLVNPAKQIIAQTEKVLAPNMMMISTLTWLYITGKRYGSVDNPSDMTVAQAALASLKEYGITSFLWVPEVGYREDEKLRLQAHGIPAGEAARLAGGLSSQQTMVVGRRDPKVAEMIVGKERILYPARETVHGRVEVRAMQGSGGIEFYKPAGFRVITNCGPDTVI
jgi:hypothetical protein